MIEILNDLLRKNKLGESGKSILIEDRIFGKEVSVFCFTDGKNYSKPVAICDYKRVFDNDLGSNTGGMGCYSPPEFWSKDLEKNILEKIVDPTIKSMNDIKSSFKGILYTGIMITESGPKVIEYNCRFGDPECQTIMPLMDKDFVILLQKCSMGKLTGKEKIHGPEVSIFALCDGERYILLPSAQDHKR